MRKLHWLVRFGVLALLIIIVFTISGALGLTTIAARMDVIVKIPLTYIARAKQGIQSALVNTVSKYNGQSKFDELEREIRKLIYENARLQEVKEENARLRRELEFFEQKPYPITIARVLGRVHHGDIAFLVLDQGSDNDIQPNAPVVVDGTIVAKIVKSGAEISIAAPLIDPTMKTAAAFAEEAVTAGIVEGEFNTSLVMQLIPKDINLQIGKIVITSGLEPGIPRGFVIGTVERSESNPQNLFQTAYLKQLIRLEDLILVSIVKTQQEISL